MHEKWLRREDRALFNTILNLTPAAPALPTYVPPPIDFDEDEDEDDGRYDDYVDDRSDDENFWGTSDTRTAPILVGIPDDPNW